MATEFTPPDDGAHVITDVAGVPGLLLLTGAFTEDFERACFEVAGPVGTARLDGGGRVSRTGEAAISLERFSLEMWAVINLVRDSGLMPQLSTPDYCLAWGYPPGTSFQPHFDSRYQWGEAVVGATFGAPCEIRFSFERELALVRWL